MKEERELAKKREAELKKSGAEKMKELLVSFFSLAARGRKFPTTV